MLSHSNFQKPEVIEFYTYIAGPQVGTYFPLEISTKEIVLDSESAYKLFNEIKPCFREADFFSTFKAAYESGKTAHSGQDIFAICCYKYQANKFSYVLEFGDPSLEIPDTITLVKRNIVFYAYLMQHPFSTITFHDYEIEDCTEKKRINTCDYYATRLGVPKINFFNHEMEAIHTAKKSHPSTAFVLLGLHFKYTKKENLAEMSTPQATSSVAFTPSQVKMVKGFFPDSKPIELTKLYFEGIAHDPYALGLIQKQDAKAHQTFLLKTLQDIRREWFDLVDNKTANMSDKAALLLKTFQEIIKDIYKNHRDASDIIHLVMQELVTEQLQLNMNKPLGYAEKENILTRLRSSLVHDKFYSQKLLINTLETLRKDLYLIEINMNTSSKNPTRKFSFEYVFKLTSSLNKKMRLLDIYKNVLDCIYANFPESEIKKMIEIISANHFNAWTELQKNKPSKGSSLALYEATERLCNQLDDILVLANPRGHDSPVAKCC